MIDEASAADYREAIRLGAQLLALHEIVPQAPAMSRAERVWGQHPGTKPLLIWPNGDMLLITTEGRLYLWTVTDGEPSCRKVTISQKTLRQIYFEFFGRWPGDGR